MKITLKRTPEQLELIKAMASKNRDTAYAAQVALAEFIGPVVSEVINNAPTISNLFTPLQYNADDNPSLPLDLYYNVFDEDYIQVWSQSVAGGLPTNMVQPTASELKFTTYTLDSAVAFDRKYASRSRLDVIGKTFTRVAQEVLLKQERTSSNLLMTALAEATSGNATYSAKNRNVFRTAAAGVFQLDDINKLITKAKRVNASWSGGTPTGARHGITDLIVSPEVVEQIRSMAYQPMNTRNGATTVSGTGANQTTSTSIPATDAIRNEVWKSSGITEFFGINIQEVLELGVGKRYNDVFDTVAGATDYLQNGSTTTSAVFAGATEQILVGLDRSRDALVRAIAVDSDTGSEFNLVADDQFSIRQQRIGFYGALEEGRMVLDNRALVGLIM
ncbi:MAG TPA: hypothetical protein EYQ26_00935 [Rhodospirillales bacterium]|nr:hypothetical protein [Rhodospirillales bacterium]